MVNDENDGRNVMAKILIIDDDPDLIESMRVVLTSKEHEVISAPGGEEGLEALKKEKPNLVILDVMMPEMDGFEVARKMKKDSATGKIPILMLTAIKEKMGLDFKKEAGDEAWLPVDDYCEKPIDQENLLTKVGQLLNL
jgi:CheY-like chemotaxis protein